METKQRDKATGGSVFESQGVDPRELAVLHWDALSSAFREIADRNGKDYGELIKHAVVLVGSDLANTGSGGIVQELPETLVRLIGQALVAAATELDARHALHISAPELQSRLEAIKSKSSIQD